MMSGTKDSSEVMQNLLHEKEALVAKVAQLAENKESLASKCNVLQDKVGNMEGELKKLREDLQKKNEEVNKMKQEGPALAKVRQEEMAAAIAAAAAHAAPPTQAAQVVAADRATDKMARRSSSLYVTTKKEGVETVVNAHVPTINEVEIAATAATTINGTSGTNGTAPTINEPQVESIVVSKPKSRRRMSSTQLQTVATDHIQKRATISAATMSPTRLRALENKSRANRISMLMRSSTATDSNREKLAAMLGSPGLEYELINGLIKNLTVPMADLNVRLAAKEILFPSHLIGLTIAQMWSYSLIEPMKKVLYGVLKTLQLQVTQFDIDYSFAFWFANVIELHSILTNVETLMSGTDSPHSTEIRRIVAEVKGELRQLAVQIATGWLKILLGRMNKLVIPGVVESQSLPGFTCTLQSSGGFVTKIMGGGQSDVTVDAVLNFLTKLWKIIQFYFIDQEIAKNIVLEILDSIGMTAFNQLLVRKNFCSWKRGMQIQYNVTRVEEWCKTHSIHQQSLNLERLMQAAKLLQLQKKTSQDVDVMFEVCYLLNPQQMKKILGIYAVSDYENPIGGEVLQEVGSRPNTTNDNGLFLEVKPRLENTAFAMGRPAVTVENYLPEWLDLPKVRLVITMS
jgi:myosin-5